MRFVICFFGTLLLAYADDAESAQTKIARAMSAGPADIASAARIVDICIEHGLTMFDSAGTANTSAWNLFARGLVLYIRTLRDLPYRSHNGLKESRRDAALLFLAAL